MTEEAKLLVRAILTRIKERDGSANKTKLLKLLYLADLENFRAEGRTLTGFDWIFYQYGPWAAQYDGLLDQLAAENLIKMDKWAASELEGTRIEITESAGFGKVIKSTTALMRAQRYVDTWADKSVGSLLDYVYFETEPMLAAEKGQRLDFTKVQKQPPALYRRTPSTPDPKQLRSIKEKFMKLRQSLEAQREKSHSAYKDAPHDQVFTDALLELNGDDL